MKLKIGDPAKWKSQAGGTVREKVGVVRAIVTCGESLRVVLRRLKIEVPRGAVKADADTSMFDRYLIEVMVERKRGGPKPVLYVPKVSVVDAQVDPPRVAQPARQESLFASAGLR
jgi:hypothetical protein